MDTTLGLSGRSTRHVLDDDKLTIGKRVIELAAITRVRLATLGDTLMCELTLRDGTTTTIANNARDKRASYGALIRELHAKLATRKGVEYVRGAWLLVGIMVGIGVAVVLLSAALWKGWITLPGALADRASLFMILGVVWLVLGPLLVWRSRPHGYDPHAVPADLLD